MQNDNELIWEAFLNESPFGYHTLPSMFERKMSEMNVDDIKSKTFVERFGNMDIYHDKDGDNDVYYILVDNEIAAYYRFKDEGKYLKTKLTWNSKKHTGTLRKFLGEYLLPKRGIIESDDAFSNDAFTMWQKMVVEYPDYEFYAKFPDGRMSKRMTNYHEPLLYREPMFKGDGNSTFVMKYGTK